MTNLLLGNYLNAEFRAKKFLMLLEFLVILRIVIIQEINGQIQDTDIKVISSMPDAAGYGSPLPELKDVTYRVYKVFTDLSESEVKKIFFDP